MDVSKNRGTPKSSVLIGLSIIFTIHFGGKFPLFLETPISSRKKKMKSQPRIEFTSGTKESVKEKKTDGQE